MWWNFDGSDSNKKDQGFKMWWETDTDQKDQGFETLCKNVGCCAMSDNKMMVEQNKRGGNMDPRSESMAGYRMGQSSGGPGQQSEAAWFPDRAMGSFSMARLFGSSFEDAKPLKARSGMPNSPQMRGAVPSYESVTQKPAAEPAAAVGQPPGPKGDDKAGAKEGKLSDNHAADLQGGKNPHTTNGAAHNGNPHQDGHGHGHAHAHEHGHAHAHNADHHPFLQMQREFKSAVGGNQHRPTPGRNSAPHRHVDPVYGRPHKLANREKHDPFLHGMTHAHSRTAAIAQHVRPEPKFHPEREAEIAGSLKS